VSVVSEPVGLELSGAAFSVLWRALGVHQALARYDDRVWFWTLGSPEPQLAALVGTFACDLEPGEGDALDALAERAAADSTPGPSTGLNLVLGYGSGTALVPAGTQLAADVEAAVAPLRERAVRSPVAAVAVRAGVVQPPAGPAILGLTFSSAGSAPVVIRVDGESLRLADGEGWRQLAAPRMGLVDGAGHLLDGLYRPATVPAGGLGAWVLPGVDVGVGERVLVRGLIEVCGPPPPAMVDFEVSAELVADLAGGVSQ
jgi:hypothetical protein